LRSLGYETWSAADAGLWNTADDDLAVYADEHRAALLTHDKAFSRRRQRNIIGSAITSGCAVPNGKPHLLRKHIDEIVQYLRAGPDIWIRISKTRFDVSRRWD
jgi:hypothetical protein